MLIHININRLCDCVSSSLCFIYQLPVPEDFFRKLYENLGNMFFTSLHGSTYIGGWHKTNTHSTWKRKLFWFSFFVIFGRQSYDFRFNLWNVTLFHRLDLYQNNYWFFSSYLFSTYFTQFLSLRLSQKIAHTVPIIFHLDLFFCSSSRLELCLFPLSKQ